MLRMNTYDHLEDDRAEEQKRTWVLHYPKCNEAVEADLRAPTTRGHVP
jgi:hypothetical protein